MKQHITKKLKTYHLLTKSYHRSHKHQRVNTLSKVALGTIIPIAAVNFAHAQCQGAFMGGADVGFGTATPALVDIDGGGNDLSIYTAAGNTYVKGLNGAKIFGTATGTLFSARRFAANEAIPGAAASATKATLAFGSGANGNWGNDGTGFLGIINGDGELGFVALSLTNSMTPVMLSISQMGFNTVVGGSVSGGDCNSLPVELMAFEATAKEEYIQLQWKTASEIDNAGFEIERSENGKIFKSMAFVEGKGNSTAQQSYKFGDTHVLKGKNYYYRLKQIDFNGNFEYSEIITANLKGKGEITGTFIPNPTHAGLTELNYHTTKSGELNLQIFDVVGKELWSQRLEIKEGKNTLPLDLSVLSAGVYFVKMEQGSIKTYEQLVIE